MKDENRASGAGGVKCAADIAMSGEKLTGDELAGRLRELEREFERLGLRGGGCSGERLLIEPEQLLGLFDILDQPVNIVDFETYEVLYANRAFREEFGEVTGKTCYRAYHARESPCDDCPNEKILKGKAGRVYVCDCYNEASGRWYRCVTGAIPWVNGRMAGWRARTDVTASKRAQKALREMNERLEATLNALPDLMFEVDYDGRFHDYRAPVPEKLYAPPDVFLGKTVVEVLPADAAGAIMDAVWRVAATGEKTNVSYALKLPHGLCHFEATLAPVRRAGGGPGRIIALVRDMTERVRSERALNEAVREARFYFDLMSHDLTNFNHVILGNLDLLEKSLEPDEVQRKRVSACKRQIVKSETLISNVRAFAAVKDITDESLEPVDLNRCVADAAATVRALYPGKRVEIEFEASGEKSAMGTTLLESALVNVMGNAARHSPGERAWISVAIAEAEEDPGGTWEIRIEDRGPGVPDGMKKKIFDRYVTVGEEKGTGLGLSLARAIVEKLGGRIRVEDRVRGVPAKGSVFRITVPRARG
ncbi:MAG: ATP-binding protein [bacterium]